MQRDPVPMPAAGPAVTTAPRDAEGAPWGTSEEDMIDTLDKARAKTDALGTLAESSTDVPNAPSDDRVAPKPDVPIFEDDDQIKEDERGDSSLPRRPRRTPTRYADAGVATEITQDWTIFDIGKVARALRTTNQSTLQRVLRKLHVRWWHASEHTMIRFLQRVGVSDDALKFIPAIARSCAVCRDWARPGPSSAANIELPDVLNEQVECDLIFIYDWVIIHLLDRCTRWHAAMNIPNKEAETLVTAIDQMWMQMYGPPRELIVDGEAGVQLSHFRCKRSWRRVCGYT